MSHPSEDLSDGSHDAHAAPSRGSSRRAKSKDEYIGEGVALGLSFGVIFAIAVGNMAFIGIGLPIGIAIAEALYSSNHKDEGAE